MKQSDMYSNVTVNSRDFIIFQTEGRKAYIILYISIIVKQIIRTNLYNFRVKFTLNNENIYFKVSHLGQQHFNLQRKYIYINLDLFRKPLPLIISHFPL